MLSGAESCVPVVPTAASGCRVARRHSAQCQTGSSSACSLVRLTQVKWATRLHAVQDTVRLRELKVSQMKQVGEAYPGLGDGDGGGWERGGSPRAGLEVLGV